MLHDYVRNNDLHLTFSSVLKILIVNPHITRQIYGKTFTVIVTMLIEFTLQLHNNNLHRLVSNEIPFVEWVAF